MALRDLSTFVAGVVLPLSICSAPASAQEHAPPLPAYNAKIGETSVSGISSGAYMAGQFSVAWSSVIKGVGLIAGGPYFCAQGTPGRTPNSGGGSLSADTAQQQCMANKPPGPDLPALFQRTDEFALDRRIDDPANLGRQKIYVFNGYNDPKVLRKITDAVPSYYAHYVPPQATGNLFYQNAIGAGHAQVTADYGDACAITGGEHINNCGYDQAGIILQHIYGRLQPKNTSGKPLGKLVAFTQRDFIGGGVVPPKTFGLAETGYAYVPDSCATTRCRVHIALHGCLQNAEMIGQAYILRAGYNKWADTNAIIVVYPQTTATNVKAPVITDPFLPVNPYGCWDWWGYTDSNYATKRGDQIAALKAIIDRLTTRPWGPQQEPANTSAAGSAGLAVIDASDTAIDLAWSAVPGAETYDVYRKASDGHFALAATINGLSYADSGLTPDTTFKYAVFPAGEEPRDFSGAITAATRPTPPRCGDPGHCAVN